MITNEAKKEALKAVAAQRKEKANTLVIETLKKFVDKDLPVFDIYYIHARLKEILEAACEKIDFDSTEIRELRKKHLAEIVQLVTSSLPRAQEYKKNTKDATEIRNARCEPVAFELAKMVLSPELLLTDEAYINLGIEEHEETLFKAIVEAYIGALFEGTSFSFDESFAIANQKLWNGKRRDQVTARQLDAVMKQE